MQASDPLGLLGETVAGKYVVESVVGTGGFATVYRARHLVWQRPVALKVFNLLADATEGRQKELVEAFFREGAILAQLSEQSPAICQARDAATLTTTAGLTLPYLVLEWLDGSTLGELMEVESVRGRAPRTLAEAVDLLEPIAQALALAHRCGIVHRDVKPANIFVLDGAHDAGERRYALKLLDFGVAKVRSDAASMGRTGGAFTAFTPTFAAPEQFSRTHGATGPWTDAYALALVLVELVTGREAQAGADIAAVATVARDLTVRPTPRTRGAIVSDAVETVFLRALAVDPAARYPDMTALWSALHDALGLEPFEPPRGATSLEVDPARVNFHQAPTLDVPSDVPITHEPTLPSAPRPRSLVLAVAAVATLFAVAAAAGAAWLFSSRSIARGAASSVPLVSKAPIASASAAPGTSATPAPACPADMVAIPGGTFFMGDDDGSKYARPAHNVRLRPYCIDRTEVTVASYKECSDAGECKRAGLTNAWTGIDTHQRDTFDPLCNGRDSGAHARHPINCVDWEMANRFCESREKRLPTEAEWEFAARGPDGRKYPWGDDPPSAKLLNACGTECEAWGAAHGEDERAMYKADDGFATTAPVGSFPAGASRYGVVDVVGNVWEWVDDWFGAYGADAVASPKGPEVGTERVIRGGAWNGREPSWVRPSFRYKTAPTDRSYGTGFRCAKG